MSQVRFVGWSQVQETKNWYDFSGATFSCLTFYTASKMTAQEVFVRLATVLSDYLRILQKDGFTLSPSMGHFKGALYRVS